MFKFNFNDGNDEEQQIETTTSKKPNPTTTTWLKSEQIIPNKEKELLMKDIFTNCEENTLECDGLTLKYFSPIDVLNVLRTSDDSEATKKLSVLRADQSHSDLETAVYEGGLKIWECTFDLINYIVDDEDLDFENKNVLDLGCGAGLIGVLCLLKGSSCTFQDYNAEILQYITIPNVALNDEAYLSMSKFYSGDWASFIEAINISNEESKFDYIFTSETIYNLDNYEKLHNVFQSLLKKEGKIFLAAKTYYFGVGGGISSFNDFLKKKNLFKSASCWKCTEGLKREINKITFI